MQKIKQKLMNHRVLSILTVVVVFVVLATVIYAATTVLDQTVGVNVTVNPAPSGGSGGDSTPVSPTSAYIYTDDTLTYKLNTLTFSYYEGGYASTTAYMKSSDVEDMGLVEGNTLTVNPPTEGGLSDSITITATLGAVGTTVTPVYVKAEGGTSSTGTYTGNVTFTETSS